MGVGRVRRQSATGGLEVASDLPEARRTETLDHRTAARPRAAPTNTFQEIFGSPVLFDRLRMRGRPEAESRTHEYDFLPLTQRNLFLFVFLFLRLHDHRGRRLDERRIRVFA